MACQQSTTLTSMRGLLRHATRTRFLFQVGWKLGCTRKAHLAVYSGFCLVIECLPLASLGMGLQGWLDT